MSGPPEDSTPEAAYDWWRARADAGDGEAMVEVAECLERGRGAPKNVDTAVGWYARAVRAGIALAPALTGETVFERDPVAGLVWLMLGLERAGDGSDLLPTFLSSLSVHGSRASDEAVQAAQVWADACRERSEWPDRVPMPLTVAAPFRPRPPTPVDLPKRPRTSLPESQRVSLRGFVLAAPADLSWETLLDGSHLRARREGLTLHVVSAQLAPGVDIESYVRRSIGSSGALWHPVHAAERFLLGTLDTFSVELEGAGPSRGHQALKRFSTIDDRVAILTAVTPHDQFPARRLELETIFDTLLVE